MNLSKKKELAAKALGVGKGRVIFKQENLTEIKEAITRQDIKSLKDEGIISIKPIKGRKKVEKRKRARGPGKIKMKVNNRKQEYVKITRKLRTYVMNLRDRGVLDRDLYKKLRNKIRMREFRSLANLKDHLRKLDSVDFDKKSEVKVPVTKKIKKKIEKKESKKKTVKKAGKETTKKDKESKK